MPCEKMKDGETYVMEKVLMKGNEAIAEAAIQAGCRFFFGYPITPQNQIPEYMSKRMPQVGGCFLQSESEVSAINMVYGAAGAGARTMTSSSSPGISLKQEGISYIVGAELPCVIVNIMRAGPGLGAIQPGQGDYFQSTRGGGHGDYYMPVLAPASVQEAVTLMQDAFDIADKYRTPVMVMGDGMLGQMMEPVQFPDYQVPKDLPEKKWAANGRAEDGRHIINSMELDSALFEKTNIRLQEKYDTIRKNEVRFAVEHVDDAEVLVVAYGTTARIVRSAMALLRKEGVKAGLFRPITVWPYPYEQLRAAAKGKKVLVVEMSAGQMVEDVRLAVQGYNDVSFYGRLGGQVPQVADVAAEIRKLAGGGK